MGKLIICAFAWGQKYGAEYVERLAAGVCQHLSESHRFVLISEWMHHVEGVEVKALTDFELTKIKGCFARLRLFDAGWQHHVLRALPGDRIACMDLDSIVTGPLDPLFNRPDNFTILTGANAANPCPYNGSLWMLRAGYRPDVWTDFSLEAAAKVPHYEFPDDQAWFAHKLPGVVGWKVGAPSGVYAFQKPGWPKGDDLPADARLVVFPGWRDPSKFTHLPWVKERWAA